LKKLIPQKPRRKVPILNKNMSFLNKIKSAIGGSKKTEKPKKKEAKPKKETGPKQIIREVSKNEPIKPISKKKDTKDVYRVLREPHISEKSTYLSDQNKYVFKIFETANKIQVKSAVANLYGVRVKNVTIINEKSKSRKMRNISGHKPGYKKAIVTLEKGYKIEILPH
jgi:large subunit ribosomal protein L23